MADKTSRDYVICPCRGVTRGEVEDAICKCQYKNVGKVENNNVCFCYSSAACVSIRDRTSLMRYDGPFMEIIVE